MTGETDRLGERGPGGAAVVFDPARYRTARAYAAAVDRGALVGRARAAIAANVADPRLTPATLALWLGVDMAALRDGLRPSGTVRATIRDVRLGAALLALASWPLSTRPVTEVAYAHSYSDVGQFGQAIQRRLGRSPSEVLAMRAVWPAGGFRGWLEEQADWHGFRARLDGLEVGRRSMVRAPTAAER